LTYSLLVLFEFLLTCGKLLKAAIAKIINLIKAKIKHTKTATSANISYTVDATVHDIDFGHSPGDMILYDFSTELHETKLDQQSVFDIEFKNEND
jgi:hypothetical protein